MKKKFGKVLYRGILLATTATMFMAGTLLAQGNGAGETASLDGDEIEYDMNTGVVTVTGNILMVKGDSKVTGARAEYNSKTQEGIITGNVIAIKENMRVTADQVTTSGKDQLTATGSVVATKDDMRVSADTISALDKTHFVAKGSVNGSKADKTFSGAEAEYYSDQEYVIMASGGTITSLDGTFTADRLEGYLKDAHYVGIGSVHIVSPKNNLEAGGNAVDYYGINNGKAIITGDAWAVQDNNTLKSNRITVYLSNEGKATVK